MEPRRRKLLARLLLGGGVITCAAWLAQIDYARKISTDVLELLPADERQPELTLVRSLANEHQARAALFALDGGAAVDAESRARAGSAFVAELRASAQVAEVVSLDDEAFRQALGRFFFERRFELLLPDWLADRTAAYAAERAGQEFAAWLAERTAAELETFLQQPDALGLERALAADPLLLIPRLMDAVQGIAGGDLMAGESGRMRIWARLAVSPLTEDGQAPVFAAVERATSAAQRVVPSLDVQWTAVSRFAAASRQRIQAELTVLNAIALVAVLTVAGLCLRRVRQLLHLAPGVLCSFLGAWTLTTLVHDRVHALVFVIGSLLGGIASDYALHLYLHEGRPGEDFAARVRAVRRPLVGSALTAMIGFSALLLSDLPLIRHVGLFVLAGLVGAMVSALLWFAQVRNPQGELRPRVQHGLIPAGRAQRLARRAVLLAGAVVVAGGIWRIQWSDDIRDLEVPTPELWANDRAVRARFGEEPGRHIFLARGNSPAEARRAVAGLADWIRDEHPDAALSSVGFAMPTQAAWDALPATMARLAGFDAALRATLEHRGFDAGEFRPFFSAWREFESQRSLPSYDSLVRDFTTAIRGPASMLFSTAPAASWYAVAMDGAQPGPVPSGLSVVDASQLESLNRLFRNYRRSALQLSLVGLAAASASVLLIYGRRQGPRMLLIPLGACLTTFGVFGLIGAPLNLFHLLGAFLALCLCFDYAIFTGERAARGGSGAPPSVRLSALNTMASFGVLAFSRIPVVAALGTTVALIAGFALVLVELHSFRRSHTPE